MVNKVARISVAGEAGQHKMRRATSCYWYVIAGSIIGARPPCELACARRCQDGSLPETAAISDVSDDTPLATPGDGPELVLVLDSWGRSSL